MTVVSVEVSISVAVTVTPGILDPLESVTVPTMPPVVSCAIESCACHSVNTAQTTKVAKTDARFAISLPLGNTISWRSIAKKYTVNKRLSYSPLLGQCQEVFTAQNAMKKG